MSAPRLLSVIAAAVVLAACTCAPSAPAPYVVVIVLDTVRYDALGCNGNPHRPTPHLDSLTVDGVRYENAISSSGWTLPAMASLMSGAWPSIHGGLGRGTNLSPVRAEVPMAAEVLKARGFATAGFANAAFVSPKLGFGRGFDVFDHVYAYNQDTRRANETIDAALAYVRDHRTEPTLLFIHLFDPHLDYDPPGNYRNLYTRGRSEPAPPLSLEACLTLQRNDDADPPSRDDIDYVSGVYLGEVAFTDAHIGRFLQEFETLGLYDDATIIVTSDHGEEFWEHGGFEHGHTLHDELVRVPLIIKFPAYVSLSRHVVPEQVRVLDVMPTVFDLHDIVPPESFIGRSLLPLARGGDNVERVAFSESVLYGTRMVSWRTSRYKYIHDIEAGEHALGQLYDCIEDPAERNDLRVALPDVAEAMRSDCMEFYLGMLAHARTMSPLEPIDMSPEEIDKLRSLGYIR